MSSIEEALTNYFDGDIKNVTNSRLNKLVGIINGDINNKLIKMKKEYLRNKRNVNDNMEIEQTTVQNLINGIEQIEINYHGSNTQMTAHNHEINVYEIFKSIFNTEDINKREFREFIRLNGDGRQWSEGENSLNRVCDDYLPINNNSLNLQINKNYLIEQPSGGQDYPDYVLIRLDMDSNLQILYIECKQKRPKFNNNPPKMKKNCLYICGNELYNGFLLTTPEWQDHKERYITRYRELINEFNTDEFRVVLYKVIELKWITGEGPKCFTERVDQNIPLITETVSRFINY